LLHFLFSSLTVSLSGEPVTLHENNYHYKYYLEKLLNYGSDTTSTHLITSFWYPDTATGDGLIKAEPGNSGYVRRIDHLNDRKTVEFIGMMLGDLFISNSMLMNGVDMNIKLTRTPSCSICWDLQMNPKRK
jgi:hypothetical protein